MDPSAAGRALRECHAALATFEADLPELGALEEAAGLLARLRADGSLDAEDGALLAAVADRVLPAVAALPGPRQALHGDAHLGNVLPGPGGALWCDWEDTFAGPPAWDLGCLVAAARTLGAGADCAEAALAGHGGSVDPETLELMVEARTFQAAVWAALYQRIARDRNARLAGRLEWLRGRAG